MMLPERPDLNEPFRNWCSITDANTFLNSRPRIWQGKKGTPDPKNFFRIVQFSAKKTDKGGRGVF